MLAYWDIIDLPFQTPWFVISYLETQIPQHEGELKRRTKLVHRLDHLENFITSVETDSTNIENVQVQVVMPGHMTGRPRWTMEPLKAILSGLIPGSATEQFNVFETSDGSRFAEYISSASLGRIQMSTRLKISSVHV